MNINLQTIKNVIFKRVEKKYQPRKVINTANEYVIKNMKIYKCYNELINFFKSKLIRT